MSSDKLVQAKKNSPVSCSCTKKSDSTKVVTKSAECKAGMSKSECCSKAAKAWPSVKHCKYESQSSAPELGGGNSAGNPSNGCKQACNTAAGSQCVMTSGGLYTSPQCTCNPALGTAADCPDPTNYLWACSNDIFQMPQSYKGYLCVKGN